MTLELVSQCGHHWDLALALDVQGILPQSHSGSSSSVKSSLLEAVVERVSHVTPLLSLLSLALKTEEDGKLRCPGKRRPIAMNQPARTGTA